jgi:hypothetical protein
MDEIGGSGPPPIRDGEGRKHLTMDGPPVVVGLSAAGFDWLWRLVEAKYAQHAHGQFPHPEMATVAKEAVIAFREAAGTYEAPIMTPKTRKIARKATKPSEVPQEVPKVRRLVRKPKMV